MWTTGRMRSSPCDAFVEPAPADGIQLFVKNFAVCRGEGKLFVRPATMSCALWPHRARPATRLRRDRPRPRFWKSKVSQSPPPCAERRCIPASHGSNDGNGFFHALGNDEFVGFVLLPAAMFAADRALFNKRLQYFLDKEQVAFISRCTASENSVPASSRAALGAAPGFRAARRRSMIQ